MGVRNTKYIIVSTIRVLILPRTEENLSQMRAILIEKALRKIPINRRQNAMYRNTLILKNRPITRETKASTAIVSRAVWSGLF